MVRVRCLINYLPTHWHWGCWLVLLDIQIRLFLHSESENSHHFSGLKAGSFLCWNSAVTFSALQTEASHPKDLTDKNSRSFFIHTWVLIVSSHFCRQRRLISQWKWSPNHQSLPTLHCLWMTSHNLPYCSASLKDTRWVPPMIWSPRVHGLNSQHCSWSKIGRVPVW